jgi:hypothetical protein
LSRAGLVASYVALLLWVAHREEGILLVLLFGLEEIGSISRADKNETNLNIQEHISIARKTLYSLIPVGLNGKNGLNPVTAYTALVDGCCIYAGRSTYKLCLA